MLEAKVNELTVANEILTAEKEALETKVNELTDAYENLEVEKEEGFSEGSEEIEGSKNTNKKEGKDK